MFQKKLPGAFFCLLCLNANMISPVRCLLSDFLMMYVEDIFIISNLYTYVEL